MFHPSEQGAARKTGTARELSQDSPAYPFTPESSLYPSSSSSRARPSDFKAPISSSAFSSNMGSSSRVDSQTTSLPSETPTVSDSIQSIIPSMGDLSVSSPADAASVSLTPLDFSSPSSTPPLKLDEKSLYSHLHPAHPSHHSKQTSALFSAPTSFSSFSSSTTPNSSCVSLARIDKEYLILILKLPLHQIKSDILRLSKDQYGCRFLQKKLDELVVPQSAFRVQNFQVIFDQVSPFSYELIIDPFGNYLVQKLIQYCSESNLNSMLEILLQNLFQISINQHGTRALQKMIECLSNSFQLNLLINGLQPYIIELIKDLNGNHVIQRLLFKYDPYDCQFIYDSIIEKMRVVATHKHGCCVLQKCLKHVTPTQLKAFSAAILDFETFRHLINDQFGNYVLQYLISLDSWEINYSMFQNFCKYGIQGLCTSKFSSNVAEKFLKNAYQNETRGIDFLDLKFELTFKILSCDLNQLINDPYGNYVVQTSIDVLNHPDMVYYTFPGVDTATATFKAEKLALLVPVLAIDLVENEGLEVTIIKRWFQTCSISSTYGKRIQSKINSLVYSQGPRPLPFETGLLRLPSQKGIRGKDFQRGHSHSQSSASIGSYNGLYPNKQYMYGNGMGLYTNGDFLINENYAVNSQFPHGQQSFYHPSRRSASMSSTQSETSRYSLSLVPGNGNYMPFHQQSDSASSTNTSMGGLGGAAEFMYGTPHLRSDSGDFGGHKGAFSYGNNLMPPLQNPPYQHQHQHSKLQMSQVLKNGLVSPESLGRAVPYHTPHVGGTLYANSPVGNASLDYSLPLEVSPLGYGGTPARHSRNPSAHNFVGNYPPSFSTPVADAGDHGRFDSQHALHTPLPLQLQQQQPLQQLQSQPHYLWNSPSNLQQSTSNQCYKMTTANAPLEQSFLQEDGHESKNTLEHHLTMTGVENLIHEKNVSPIRF